VEAIMSAEKTTEGTKLASERRESITIKKYANRRLYNTSTSAYVTLENLAAMVKEGQDFNVYDAKTGEDLTRSVLTQIIVEEEGKVGQNLLPVGFLRQLIGLYGNNMQWLVPQYLDNSIRLLRENQDKFGQYVQNFQSSFGGIFPFQTMEDIGKQNLAMFEKMFAPFGEGVKQAQQMVQNTTEQQMQTLHQQLQSMQRQLAELSKKDGPAKPRDSE
jgi:polyhydroxyalkanoate synthesis repressor PhaR